MRTKILALLFFCTASCLCLTSCGGDDDEPTADGSGKLKGHEYVDLGLPSGTKWATCNVGAVIPGAYGKKYKWGETDNGYKGYETGYYEQSNSWYYREFTDLDGYMLKLCCDAANVSWGGNWKMPTAVQFKELIDNCTWVSATENNIIGYKVIGPNGNSIFLAEAHYWTNTARTPAFGEAIEEAYNFYFVVNTYPTRLQTSLRDYEFYVRPVVK